MNTVKKHTLFLFFILAFVFAHQVMAMEKFATENKPFLNKKEAAAFHRFLRSLNGMEELHTTHKNMLTIGYWIKTVFIPILNKKSDIREVYANNPSFVNNPVKLAITHHDTAPYHLKIVADLIGDFARIGWILHNKQIPANRFLPSATREIIEKRTLLLDTLPTDLSTYVLQLLQLNTEILSSIPAHILSTEKGVKDLSKTGFPKHFTRFCVAQEQLTRMGYLINSLTMKRKGYPSKNCSTLLQAYKKNLQLLQADSGIATNLDEVDQGVIEVELNHERLDNDVSLFFEKHKQKKCSPLQATESLEELKRHLQTKARIYRLRDISANNESIKSLSKANS